jgi:predicted PurR-regulated permease PerM
MAKKEDYSKYFFVMFVVVMIGLVFVIIRPFITALLGSVFLTYLFYPLYRWFKEKVKSSNLASLIVTIVVILVLLVPLFLILNTLTKEAYVSYLTSKQKLLTMGDFFKNCPTENPTCGLINYIGDFLNEPKVKYHLQNTIEKITSYVIDTASDLVFSIPRFVLNFFVMVFALFCLFKDGPMIINNLKRVLPLKDVYKRHLFEKFGKVTYAIVYGHLIVAVIQGILGGIGFFIFDIPSPIIWGIVMAFAALIPFIGTGFVWLPAAVFKLFSGISASNTSEIIGGVLFILYGIVIISSMDNVIRPKIIGDRAKVHPVLILVGVLGGLSLLGPVGIMVGPLVLALFVTFVNAYEKDRNNKK